MAWRYHPTGLPHALHLRRAWRAARWRTGPSATTTWSRITRRPNGRSASRAMSPTILSKARAASRCPCRRCRRRASTRFCKAGGANGWSCIRSISRCCATACPYNGRAAVHALPLVRGICLRGECQIRHAEYRDPHGAGHRQLRTPHRVPWSARSCSTTAAARPAWPTSMRDDRLQTQTGGPGGRVRRRDGIGAPAAELRSTACFRKGLGNRYDWVGRNLQGHTYTGAIGLFRGGYLRRPRPRRRDRHLRLQPRQCGPDGRRHAG